MFYNKEKKTTAVKALCAAVGICFLAAGVVAYTAFNSPETKNVPGEKTTERITHVTVQIRSFPESATEDVTLATVPVELFTEEAEAVFDDSARPLEESTSYAATEFRSPLSLDIGDDYSMGIPVFSSTMSDYRTHNGVDFVGVEGEDVCAVAEGDVISVKNDPVWGNTVTVDHGSGITSSLCGLADDDMLVTAGTHVYAGTVVGRVATVPVEADEQPHVHLEIRTDGKLTDPLSVLGLDGTDHEE